MRYDLGVGKKPNDRYRLFEEREMGEIILIIIAIVLAAKGDYTFFWIFGGLAVLVLISSLFSKSSSRPIERERPRTRIDIPHYYDMDEYVCTICGTRFNRDVMTCPYCGVRFNNTKTDERAFVEEEDEEEWWEEMEEEGW